MSKDYTQFDWASDRLARTSWNEDEYDFVSDAADWWDNLDDEKKVDIYYKNN